MPGLGVSEIVVLALIAAVGVLYLAAVVGLIVWGRRIATRLGGRWRLAPWLPVVGLLVQLGGACISVAALLTVFRGLAEVDAASRATLVARGISEAMNATACGVPISLAIYAASAVLFAIASRRGARGIEAPGPGA